MATRIVVELDVKSENRDELVGAMKEGLSDTRAYDGCNEVRLYEGDDDPNHLVIIEEWESRGHHERYMAWRTETGMMAKWMQMLSKEPRMSYLNGIRV